MLKRKIETYLAEWKDSDNKKPLVIKGLRQCGKTYIVKKFAKDNYDNVVYMNFILEPDKGCFCRESGCRHHHPEPFGIDSRQSLRKRQNVYYP